MSVIPDKTQITGLILAGGRGSRMGNIDKGLQLLNGEPMIAHVIKRLSPQVDALIINANRNLDTYKKFDAPVWPDDMTDFAGPLAGLQTGLRHCVTPYLVTVPCDSPFLPLDLVERLALAMKAQNADLAVAVTNDNGQHQSQPVFSLMKTALLPQLNAYLENGGRKIETWHASLNVVQVHFDDEAAFRNINTLEELNLSNRL